MSMKHITLKKGAKYFYIIFFIIISIISFFMLRPFTNAIIMSIIVTYIFYPIYRKLSKIITNKNLSALIMIVLVFLIVVVPSIIFVNPLVKSEDKPSVIASKFIIDGKFKNSSKSSAYPSKDASISLISTENDLNC